MSRSSGHLPIPGRRGPLTVPTLLMAQVKQWLAMAAFLASMGHMGSLREKGERQRGTEIIRAPTQEEKRPKSPGGVPDPHLRAPTVAEGLKMISAPLRLYRNQLRGWWRP